MSYTHKINDSYTTGLGTMGSTIETYTGDIEKGVDSNIPPTTTDEPVSIQWVFAKLQSLMITATGALTIKTNSATAPTTTINLAANQLIMWGNQETGACPIPGDVTGGLFITNAGAAAVPLKIRVLLSV